MVKRNEVIRLALFGQPISKSLSPVIHQQFAKQLGLDIRYDLIETGASGFPEALEAFRHRGGVGCNVTLPLKRDAWQLAARSSEEVCQAEAANTLSFEPGTGWVANTTDGVGLITDMTVNHGLSLAGTHVLVLGAGGATASVFGNLLREKPAHITLVNRNLERAYSLLARFGKPRNISVISWDEMTSTSGFDLIINSTSLGHQGKAPPIFPALFSEKAVVYDLNYYLASQPLEQRCREINKPYIDGLGMLVEQAAASFCIWTGKRPDSRAVIEGLYDSY